MAETVPPNEAKLAELREQGIVPYSRLATTCGGALFAAATLPTVSIELRSAWKLYLSLISSAIDKSPLFAIPPELAQLLLKIVFLPAISALVGASLVGVLQTKFLIRLGNIGFDLGKLAKTGDPGGVLIRLLASVPTVVCLFLVSLAIALLLLRDILSILLNDAKYLAVWSDKLSISLVTLLCLTLGILGILSWLFSRYAFMMKHRMIAENRFTNKD